MDSKLSLEQMLAAIPPQRLDQKVDDTHLGEIARKLIDWKSVCTDLAINEAEEKAIEEENKEVDARRYLHKAFVLLLRSVYMCVFATSKLCRQTQSLRWAGRNAYTANIIAKTWLQYVSYTVIYTG